MGNPVDDVVEALRSAVRALRAAERVLLQSPAGAPVSDPETNKPEIPDSSDRRETDLLSFILDSAKSLRDYEENDPQSFLSKYVKIQGTLTDAVGRGDMYQSSDGESGYVPLDNVPATTRFEDVLRGIGENGHHAPDYLNKYVENPTVKHWGDVDTNEDLVFVRIGSTEPVMGSLHEKSLTPLLDAVREIPGAIDRCRSKALDNGVSVALYGVDGSVDSSMTVDGITSRWVACLPVSELTNDVLSDLVVIESTSDNQSSSVGWWDAARSSRDIPDVVLPLVRGMQSSVVTDQSTAAQAESWCASLPGWYDYEPSPVVFRNALPNDILNNSVSVDSGGLR